MQNEDRRLFIYRIDLEDRISFVNDEWIAFGVENGLTELSEETVVGKTLWDFISDISVIHLYQNLFKIIRAKKSKPKIPYRCDSPDCRRFMQMELVPLQGGEIQLINRILKTEPRSSVSMLKESAERSSEILPVCSVCKKVRLREETWYEIEDATAILGITHVGPYPQLTHTMCYGCVQEWPENLSCLKPNF
jgi:hypothetical protein